MSEENELQMSFDAILSIRCGVILVSKLKQLVFVQTKKKHVFLSNVFIYIYGDKRWIMERKKVRQNYKARQNNWLLRRFCLCFKCMYPPYGIYFIHSNKIGWKYTVFRKDKSRKELRDKRINCIKRMQF